MRDSWLGFALLVGAFVLLTVWWMAVDERVPDFESGRHLVIAWGAYDALRAGDLL